MPPSRPILLPSNNNTPDRAFLGAFRKRHATKWFFAKSFCQETTRMESHNGTVLTHHFETLQKLIEDHGLDSRRIFHPDECGNTPERDMNGQTPSRLLFCGSADFATNESVTSRTSIASRICQSSAPAVLPLHHFLFSRELDCFTVLCVLKIKLSMKHVPESYFWSPHWL